MLFASLGSVSTWRKFGGHGIYCDGIMFALISGEVLYLKADEVSQPHYQAAHCTPFVYPMRGKPVAMTYWRSRKRRSSLRHGQRPGVGAH